ncbi:hypothetical protein EDB19DRAFT_1827272 [Suillus lakei]|nr:hypothetical protein EDB19DRAFT_1827272 [Suillus lakei]
MACAALMDQQIQNIYFTSLDDPFPPVPTARAFRPPKMRERLILPSGIRVLIDWIVQYFLPPNPKQGMVTDILHGASPVIATNKMPLVLQFSGHSQTTVGYEISKNGDTNLLVFDPSRPPRLSMRRAAIAGPSVIWEQSRTNQILQSVMHPTSNGRPSKLKHPSSSSDLQQHKRTKSSESDDEIVVVEDSDNTPKNGQGLRVSPGQTQPFTLDPTNVVNRFRLSMSKLQRKQDYQILYFPMTDPWSIEKRNERKIVTSIRICGWWGVARSCLLFAPNWLMVQGDWVAHELPPPIRVFCQIPTEDLPSSAHNTNITVVIHLWNAYFPHPAELAVWMTPCHDIRR